VKVARGQTTEAPRDARRRLALKDNHSVRFARVLPTEIDDEFRIGQHNPLTSVYLAAGHRRARHRVLRNQPFAPCPLEATLKNDLQVLKRTVRKARVSHAGEKTGDVRRRDGVDLAWTKLGKNVERR